MSIVPQCEHDEATIRRFWRLVDRSGGPDACWIRSVSHHQSHKYKYWRKETVYGKFHVGKKGYTPHRFAYEITYGPVDDGISIYRTCANLQCVNPKHLAAGEKKEVSATCSKRRKKSDKVPEYVTKGTRFRVLKRDGYRCCICGRQAKDGITLHVDHKVPRAKGGPSIESNLWTLCGDCNLGKNDDDL